MLSELIANIIEASCTLSVKKEKVVKNIRSKATGFSNPTVHKFKKYKF